MQKKIKINEKTKLLIFTSKNEFISELIKIFNEQFVRYEITNFLLPGGKTPIDFYKELSKQKFDWGKLTFSLTDERLLNKAYHKSSQLNYTNIYNHLLGSIDNMIKPDFIHLPENKENYDQSTLQEFLKRFSTFLGVGADGHIASIFPNDFDENSKETIFFSSKEHNNHYRVSWTFNSLLKSQAIFIMLSGEEKKEIVEETMKFKQNSDMPYIKLLKSFTNQVTILWNK